MYNQYNPEVNSSLPVFENLVKVFKSFLDSERISKGSIRSYTSDVRHFLSWMVFFLEANHILHTPDPLSQLADTSRPHFPLLLKHINQKVLNAYKDYLLSNNTPLKTINRRFSSLRRFGQFCKSQNWFPSTPLGMNPFETLKNISLNQPFPEDKHHLSEYRNELWKKGASKLTIKNYLADIKQFLGWVDSHGLRTDFRGSAPVGQISVNPRPTSPASELAGGRAPVISGNHKHIK